MRPSHLLPIVLLVAGLAACEKGVPIAAKPLEVKSRFCSDGKSLYRVAGAFFCADPSLRFAPRIAYSLGGNATTTFDRQVRDIIASASCLVGRPFDKVPDGQFKITIDDTVEPPRKDGGTESGASSVNLHAHWGAARTGSTSIKTTNGTGDKVGARLESGLWAFLNLSRPEPMALVEDAFAGPDTGAPPLEVAGGARYCDKERVLFETVGTYFCAPQKREWPATLGYAVVGDTAAFLPQVAAIAGFASRLTRIRYVPAHRHPAIIVVLAERKMTKLALEDAFRASGVEPPDRSIDYLVDSGDEFAKGMADAVVGKRLGPLVADWMTTSASNTTYGSEPRSSAVIGLHNRERPSTEREIEEAFLDLLKIKRPAYQPTPSCEQQR